MVHEYCGTGRPSTMNTGCHRRFSQRPGLFFGVLVPVDPQLQTPAARNKVGVAVTWCFLGTTPSLSRHGSVEKIRRTKKNQHFLHRNARTNSRAYWRLSETSARPSDARIATAVSHLIGVFFSCALFLQISRTHVELHWARRRRHHNHAASCSSAPQELSLRALDLPA